MQTLIQSVVERLQVREVHSFVQDVLVKGAREETIQQLVVVNRLRHDPADEFKITQVVGVTVGACVGLIRYSVPWGGGEEGIIRVEHLPGHDHEPFSQKSSGILSLFAFEHDIQSALHLLCASPVELSVRVFEHVFASDVDRKVVSSDSFVESFELLTEETTFDVKVEHSCMIN